MADYHPLLMRALEALSDRSPAMRRAVYDRARAALMDQLRSLDPPLSEADIARERLALEDAVNRVESEQKRRDGLADAIVPAAVGGPADPPDRLEAEAPPDEEPAPRPPASGRPAVGGPGREDAGRGEAAPRERPRIDTVAPKVARSGRGRTAVLAAALAVVIGLIAAAAYVLRDKPADLPRQPVVAEAAPAPEGESKLGERAPGAAPAPGAAAPGAAPGGAPRGDVAVAQRAMLYEENQADPQTPKVTPARAVWRLDNLNAGQGQPLETVVRAMVEIPDAKMSLSLTLRRNLDQTLPASHTVELAFTTPPGEPTRAVRDVGLLQFKNDETVRGTPVAGLPVPVKENLFLIGLSNLPADIERNTDLVTKRNWIDLPIRFSSGQRAILSFEKGLPGEQLVNEAFRQWRQP
ncbi:MAG TPA: histidine kinase [Beijerinckiaceae bacterium]|jgi:hypothetical protein